jgi:hypothetical protein
VITKILVVLCSVATPLVAQSLRLPARPPGAPTGSSVAAAITPLDRGTREDSLFAEFRRGNLPEFLRTLFPVTLQATFGGQTHAATLHVLPDYLAVGSDRDYVLIPMSPLLAQKIADVAGCVLPTKKMVDAIYAAAQVKLAPKPIAPSAAMITVPVFVAHNDSVKQQRQEVLDVYPLGALVGGTKKDVIISNKIYTSLKPNVPKPVVIYGWHQLNGVPIQPVYNGHEETYADYSHGIRLVYDSLTVDGAATTVEAVLADPVLWQILSDEGTITTPRYNVPRPTQVERSPDGPEGFLLEQNYPNPFNPTTAISYQLSAVSKTTLEVFDMVGRQVAVLVNGQQGPGRYEAHWDASSCTSGIYVCWMRAGEFAAARKMVFIR